MKFDQPAAVWYIKYRDTLRHANQSIDSCEIEEMSVFEYEPITEEEVIKEFNFSMSISDIEDSTFEIISVKREEIC